MSNIGGVEEGGICHHIKDRAAEFNPPLHYALKNDYDYENMYQDPLYSLNI